jgi:hypothetical protein
MLGIRAIGFAVLTLLCEECFGQGAVIQEETAQPLLQTQSILPSWTHPSPARSLLIGAPVIRGERGSRSEFGSALADRSKLDAAARERSFDWGFVGAGVGFSKRF